MRIGLDSVETKPTQSVGHRRMEHCKKLTSRVRKAGKRISHGAMVLDCQSLGLKQQTDSLGDSIRVDHFSPGSTCPDIDLDAVYVEVSSPKACACATASRRLWTPSFR
jgi:hypothetical protein